MKVVYILMSVVSLLLLFVFLIIGQKGLIQSPQMESIVDVATIFIGVMSMVSGIVSVKVMLSQSNPDGRQNDVEDFVIENIGEPMLSPAKLEVRTFIQVAYTHLSRGVHNTGYYPLTDYYPCTSATSEMKGMLFGSRFTDELQNRGKYFDLYFKAIEYTNPENGTLLLNKVDLFKISYVDIYEEKRITYYLNANRTTKEVYDEIVNSASKVGIPSKSIKDVTLDDLIAFVKA